MHNKVQYYKFGVITVSNCKSGKMAATMLCTYVREYLLYILYMLYILIHVHMYVYMYACTHVD